ncbi:hypothetical protein QJQ45_029906 [Haematococcus lacustris]|nr:hypothetical protein QJQ45_029906 [Haematococcus lacustris]
MLKVQARKFTATWDFEFVEGIAKAFCKRCPRAENNEGASVKNLTQTERQHPLRCTLYSALVEAGAVVASEVVEARLYDRLVLWVEACNKRALLASLILGLMVHTPEDAVIPNLAERNLYLQLGRGLPPSGMQSRPNAAVADVLAAYPSLHAELNAVLRCQHDANTVDDVGQKLETSFANSLGLTELFPRRVEQAVALAGARVIAGSHEHQRRLGLPLDGSPAWTERQRSWVARSVQGKEGVVVDKDWLERGVNRGSLLRHAVDTSRQLEEAHVSWQADWADWQALGGQRNTRPYRPPSPSALTPGCSCKAHHIKLDTQAIYGLIRIAGMLPANVTSEDKSFAFAGALQANGEDVLDDIGLDQFDSPSTPNRLTSATAGRGWGTRHLARVLCDTGATHSFVSASFAAAHAVPVHMLKHMQEWHAANNTVLSCSQFVKADLSQPGVTVPCKLNVMPSLLPDFDVLLGNDWLNEHEAVMSYQDKTLSLACDKGEPVVLPCPPADKSESGQSAVSNPASFLVNALRAKPPLASAKVAARWLRKGGTGVLALITVDNSSTPDPAPAEPDLPPGVSQAPNALLDEYADVFAPITYVVPQYRMSQEEHAELKKQVQDLLAKGMIEPSSSPFAAPILFVKKKSAELRMCLDYRQLNKITIRDQYPLPRIDDLFDKLSGCTVFSSLDLQAGYNQIRITPEDVPKTAFRTPDGHYQFKVLSFGLCNAPATFQRVMNDAFAPVLNQCALVYLDDILVMSKSVDEHLKHLRKVFDLLRLNKLYAKQSKCEFMRTTLKFLGHVIFAGAIAVDPEKIKSISSWPVPQSLQQLQSFLGAANFVRKFVHNFSVLAAPLTDLCGKAGDTFLWQNWPADELKAFASLKAVVAQVPMLRLPDHTQPFQVYCDASLQGVGAVLMQHGYPLAYLSKKLSSAERNYTTGEQELLALITACKEWRCYLEGVPFTLFTDHKPLTALPTQKVLSRRQARWMEFLSRFTFDLQYLPGDANPADPLSRIPAGPQDCAMVCVVTTRRQAKQSLERGEVRVAQALPQVPPVGTPSKAPTAVDALAPRPTVSDNPVAAHHSRLPELEAPSAADTSVHYPAAPAHPLELADHLVHGYRLDPAFTAEADLSGMYMDDHGLWRRTGKGTVMVPNDPELREYILHEMHDAAYAGHVGITKTLERLSRVFYWDTMRADVRHYVTACDACQRDKSSTLKPGGLLNPLSIPDYRWESVSMDLITKLPSASHGFDAICVFVDRLSKMVHFVPCKESMNAKGFARLFVDNVFKLHGLPKDMVSDRGPHFHNTFWHHVQKLLGMRGSLSSSYHPQSDGQTERYNRVLEEMLRHYISPTPADWPDYLSLAEFAVNNSWQESIKSTPFLVNTGQSPITPMLHSLPDKGRCPEGLSYATWWQEAVAKAKLCMQAAQQRQAAYANQDRREVHYKVGQMVLLSTKNMRLKPGKARKLLPRFVGPFKVLGLVGQVAVNLQLPASMSRLHSVFHVSLIKPYTGTDVGFMPPPVEWLDEEPVYYVERLLDHRHVHAGKAKEYLVQWEGYDVDHNTWEPRSNLVGCDKILAEYNAAHNLK